MRFLTLLFGLLIAGSSSATESVIGPTAMRNLASDLLRKDALATTDAERSKSIVALCDLYVAIRQHPSYGDCEPLRGKAAVVRHRLLLISKKLSDRLERDNIPRTDYTELVSSSLQSGEVQTARGAQSARGARAPGDFAAEGWALVELIQQTIHRDHWDVTGGAGTIHYYAMSRTLVVRATTEVHEDLAAFLGRLGR